MSARPGSRFFFQFLGTHSLLIGLFPFFLPVYLWTQGLSLSGLCLLLSVSGFSFCAVLPVWQKLASSQPVRVLVWISLTAEIALLISTVCFAAVLSVTVGSDVMSESRLAATLFNNPLAYFSFILATGLTNGVYNAFFWTTQRALFQQLLGKAGGHNDTGQQFGNLQILVTIALKIGILAGGFILENNGFIALLISSVLLCVAGGLVLDRHPRAATVLYPSGSLTTLRQSMTLKDPFGSRGVFYVDGVFLYLESHFWVLSLFLVVQQDYSQLGITVVLLAVLFAAMFYFIKDHIDGFPVNVVFRVTVFLYAVSWVLRAGLDSNSQGPLVLITLLVITFCSSLFRLAFNKLFFDLAGRSQAQEYLLMKSYVSQVTLGVFFLLAAISICISNVETTSFFTILYWLAAAGTFVYLGYRFPSDSINRKVPV